MSLVAEISILAYVLMTSKVQVNNHKCKQKTTLLSEGGSDFIFSLGVIQGKQGSLTTTGVCLMILLSTAHIFTYSCYKNIMAFHKQLIDSFKMAINIFWSVYANT